MAFAHYIRGMVMVVVLTTITNFSLYADVAEDIESAVRYCDQTVLIGPEGIWEFPDDETSVFIRRDDDKKGGYNIFLLESADCRFEPGEKVGYLLNSPDDAKFRFSIKVEKSRDVLASTKHCLATLGSEGSVMMISPMQLKIDIRTMWFLPKFWRSLKLSIDNPQNKIPVGMVKIYPENRQELPIYF